jgi:hypothetical protein
MRLRETQASRSARLEGWGGHMVRDAAHESADSGRPEIAAPHHEAERGRVCIKLIGNRFRGLLILTFAREPAEKGCEC